MLSQITEAQIVEWLQEAGVEIEISVSEYTTPFNDLGIDSLLMFEMLEVIEERTSLTISNVEFKQLITIEAIQTYLNMRL
jgi:acyl carrier protein